MRFIHASDLWLGYAFALPAESADTMREHRFDALRELLLRAEEEDADAIILAGNSLADNLVSEDIVEDFADLLASATCPVLILPGSMDPFTSNSPYKTRPELFRDPITILDGSNPVTLNGVTFHSFPVTQRDINPVLEPPPSDSAPTVAIACIPPESHGLIEGFSYAAWGGATRPQLEARGGWSGAPDACVPGEDGGHVQLVEISKDGCTTKSIKTGYTRWLREVWPFEGVDSLRSRLSDIFDGSNTLLEVRLTGQLSIKQLRPLTELLDEFSSQFLELQVKPPARLIAQPDEMYSHPLLRQVVERLLELSEASSDLETEDDEQQMLPHYHEAARWALAHLQQILEDSTHEDLV